jgi:hypothetical protein
MFEVAMLADLKYGYFKSGLPFTNGSFLGAFASSLRAPITFVSLPVCPSVRMYLARPPLDGHPRNSTLGILMKNCRKIQNLVKIGQKLRAIYIKNFGELYCCQSHTIAIKHSWQHCVAQQCIRSSLFYLHGNKYHANTPQCYVIRTLHILFVSSFQRIRP